MMYLSFKVGADAYALKMHQLIDVVPAVALKQVPESPPWLAGLLHFRQQVVPVIDLCHLATDKSAASNLGTRIAILPYLQGDAVRNDTVRNDRLVGSAQSNQPQQHSGRCYGIMAEAMTGTIDSRVLRKPSEDTALRQSPWLGEIVCYHDHLVQLIEPQALLSDAVRDLLEIDTSDGSH